MSPLTLLELTFRCEYNGRIAVNEVVKSVLSVCLSIYGPERIHTYYIHTGWHKKESSYTE